LAGSDKPSLGDGTGSRVITMDIAFLEMPDVVWLKRLLPNATVAHRSNNREVQAQLCSHGAGLAVLPRPSSDVTPNIVAFDLDEPPQDGTPSSAITAICGDWHGCGNC